MLRVSGKVSLGPSGTGGRDAKHYSTAEALLSAIEGFGLGDDVLTAAIRELNNPEARKRFIKFAQNVQIPFDQLERAGISLFD